MGYVSFAQQTYLEQGVGYFALQYMSEEYMLVFVSTKGWILHVLRFCYVQLICVINWDVGLASWQVEVGLYRIFCKFLGKYMKDQLTCRVCNTCNY